MVSLTRREGDYPFVNQNAIQEQLKSCEAPLRGFETLVYLVCASMQRNGAYDEFEFTADDEQSLLDTLILSQWEDRAWKGQLSFDVTSCETKILGGKNLTAQLNEEWNSYFLKEFERKAFQPSGGIIKPSYLENNIEDIFFCVARGEMEKSVFFPITEAPQDGILIIVNINPVEYGHIFLVPYCNYQRTQCIARAIQLITNTASEVNNSSFRMFYDYFSAMNADRTYFQASYFANPLPVELLPTIPIFGTSTDEIYIQEVSDYPLNTLVFTSKNLKKLADIMGEICWTLQHLNTVFNLLISDCGTKMYLFPQVHLPVTGRHLHTWECGGYFVYSRSSDFSDVCELEITQRLASVSLDTKGFQSLKKRCLGITDKLA
ncbi:GDP-L-galactose phosphorylase 1 [Platanthera guangdongensis]|uniref:GDP-L-galactose phosphorylase 1 n=1 Tax=Platanthera guangdongensis TaxID=2320717 RepID=A0ABR2MVS1_9ASPA